MTSRSNGNSGRRRRAALAYFIMISPNAAVGMVLSSMPAALPLIAMQVGGRETAQIIASLASFGVIAGGIVSGPLLERLQIRRCMLLALSLYAACSLGGMIWATSVAMSISRFVLGMAAVFFSSAAVALATSTYSGAARSRILGLQQASSQVANVLCVLCVGALAWWVGWRSAFLVLAGYAILLLLIVLVSVQGADTFVGSEATIESTKERLGFNFWRVCAFALLFGVLQMLPMTQLPFLLADLRAGGWISWATGVSYVLAILGAVSYVRLKLLLGSSNVFLLALVSMTGGAVIMGAASAAYMFAVASAIVGFGTGVGNTFLFDHGVEVVQARQHGKAAGLLFSSVFLGTAINPLVLFPFERWLGQHHSLLGVAFVGTALGVFGLIVRVPRRSAGGAVKFKSP